MVVGVAVAVAAAMAVAVDVAKGLVFVVVTIRTHYRQGTQYKTLNNYNQFYE